MTNWRKLMDKDFLYAYDLDGKDVTITFAAVTGGEIKGEGGKTTKKPVATIVGTPKKLALNATNCKTIEQLYGPDVRQWAGKRVTLFASTTSFGAQSNLPCIRIRPVVPPAAGKGKVNDLPADPAPPQLGDAADAPGGGS